MARRKKNENEEVNIVQEQKEVSESIDISVAENKKIDRPVLKTVITKEPIPFRIMPSKNRKYYSDLMPANTAFTIMKEISNISGDWFRLSNNKYIPATGNYIIK